VHMAKNDDKVAQGVDEGAVEIEQECLHG
jgi:hypothetical protein